MLHSSPAPTLRAFAVQLGMSVIKLIYPVADIGGSFRNIATQCDSGDLETALGYYEPVDSDNIDVAAILRVFAEPIKVSTISRCFVSRC